MPFTLMRKQFIYQVEEIAQKRSIFVAWDVYASRSPTRYEQSLASI